ncbi:MAG: hypothetical protein JWP75_236, partial [Frondihabitans sp.]|nr:hypothetical protein [Frondihabitans sp.]
MPPRALALLFAFLTTALVAATLTVLPAQPAGAVASQGHGRGYLWHGDGVSWLGSYVMADGRFAFCIEAGKPSPVGNEYNETTSEDLPGLSSSDTARLAYIARTWAASADDDTAAAGQLAVWTITGLAGHTQEYYAARANERAGIVLTKARAMLAEATSEATTSVTARLRLTVPDDRGATLLADLVTNQVDSGVTTVPPGAHQGLVTLVGATFTDGATRRNLPNGTRVTILPRSNLDIVRVRADISFIKLPYGRSVTVGHSPTGSQSLLYSANGSAARDDSVATTAVSRLPFQPSVVTQTSSQVATAGAEISDQINLRARPGDGLLDNWGVYRDGSSFSPIPVTIRSRLLGPFETAPTEQAEWPSDAPTVCEVATVAEKGAGRYQTKSCR